MEDHPDTYGSIDINMKDDKHIYRSLFDNPCLERLNNGLDMVMFPQTTFVNIMMSSLKLTSNESYKREWEDPCYERYVLLSVLLPGMAILMILYLPVFCLCFLIWAPIQRYRHPYRMWVGDPSELKHKYDPLTIVTMDTRLLIEYKARWKENLAHVQRRANTICQRLQMKSTIEDSSNDYPSGRTEEMHETVFQIADTLPDSVNTICFQGVFDTRAEKKLVRHLRQSFAYVISDVTINSWWTNHFRLGSGLVVASLSPIVDVEFQCFNDATGDDVGKAKGCLVVKVELNSDGKRRFLNIRTVELQEGYDARSVDVRCKQLTQLSQWITTNRQNAGNKVPEIICGNFHFDNVSQEEKANWSHPWFNSIVDVCVIRPGEDRAGTTGTELKSEKLYDNAVSTPAAMKRTLETRDGKLEFLEHGETHGDTPGGDTGSRTNRIVYYDGSLDKVNIVKYTVLTTMAGLTTHLPVVAEIELVQDHDE